MKRLLVIEWDEGIRELFVLALSRLGYEICTASDGAEGLRTLETTTVDAVLVNFVMPKMNGAEFIEAAKERGYSVPMIAVSGHHSSEFCLAHGAVAVLRLPFQWGELESLLESVLG